MGSIKTSILRLRNHPNIVPVHGYVTNMGTFPSPVTPYYANGDALRYLDRNPSANKLRIVWSYGKSLCTLAKLINYIMFVDHWRRECTGIYAFIQSPHCSRKFESCEYPSFVIHIPSSEFSMSWLVLGVLVKRFDRWQRESIGIGYRHLYCSLPIW